MLFDNFDKSFYINDLNTVLMRGNHESDDTFFEYMMASGYAIQFKFFTFKQPSNVVECNIVRPLL